MKRLKAVIASIKNEDFGEDDVIRIYKSELKKFQKKMDADLYKKAMAVKTIKDMDAVMQQIKSRKK